MRLFSLFARAELAPLRRPVLVAASACLLVKADRLVQREGVRRAQEEFLAPWDEGAEGPAAGTAPRVLDEIDAAIDVACQWLPVPMSCLPRSMVAYALSFAMGARPTHHMGVRARPYYGHAWTSVGDRVVGDALGDQERAALRVVKRFPSSTGTVAAPAVA